MGTVQPRRRLTDFADLREPPGPAGGLVLAVPFDTLLREFSETYLRAAWQRVAAVLERYQLALEDLCRGDLSYSVYTPGFPPPAPDQYVGWVSQHLYRFDEDPRYGDVAAALRAEQPALGCAFSLRSHKWLIAPGDTHLGLQLIEALVSTGELTGWAPATILPSDVPAGWWHPYPSPNGPWIHVAQAIAQRDQQLLDEALAEAQAHYSPIGYWMMVRGYAAYLDIAELAGQFLLPDVAD
jgi:hypothetical protein